MKRILTILFSFILSGSFSQIHVSENHRFLSEKDGTPFFWLGDTDWELFHRLTREEAIEFINIRSKQGFNVLHAVALAEFNGIRQPNRYGDWPLNNEDPTQLAITPGNNPNDAYEYDYWDHVDFIIEKAAEKGIYIGLLPTWGDKVTEKWGDGPVIFNKQNAEIYGRNLATRYSKQWNIIWILGGDRPAIYKSHKDQNDTDDRPIWRAMATGIESVAGKDAFITYHPAGGSTRTSSFITDEKWLDMHAFQSGHGSRDPQPWQWVKEDLASKPERPVLDMEPCYEDHPVNPWDGKWTRASRGYFTAYDVRARIYRGVFAGACGVTYGHHQVWQFMNSSLNPPVNIGDTIIPWRTALNAEAAREMVHLKNLMLSRPYYSRIEDATLVKSKTPSTYTDAIVATRESGGAYAFVYLPQNKPVSIDLSKIKGSVKKIWWYDPRTGKSISGKDIRSTAVQPFTPPKEGKDWVLVIDDGSRNFGAPEAPQ